MNIFRTSIKKLKEAKQKRFQRKNIGTDDEYSKVIIDELDKNNYKYKVHSIFLQMNKYVKYKKKL